MRRFIYVGAIAGLVVGALPGALVGFVFALFAFGIFGCGWTGEITNSCLYGEYGAGMVLFSAVPALISGAVGAALGAFGGALLDEAITDISNRKENSS